MTIVNDPNSAQVKSGSQSSHKVLYIPTGLGFGVAGLGFYVAVGCGRSGF